MRNGITFCNTAVCSVYFRNAVSKSGLENMKFQSSTTVAFLPKQIQHILLLREKFQQQLVNRRSRKMSEPYIFWNGTKYHSKSPRTKHHFRTPIAHFLYLAKEEMFCISIPSSENSSHYTLPGTRDGQWAIKNSNFYGQPFEANPYKRSTRMQYI